MPYETTSLIHKNRRRILSGQSADTVKTVIITQDQQGVWATVDDRRYRITPPETRRGALFYTVDDKRIRSVAMKVDGRWHIHLAGWSWILEPSGPSGGRAGESGRQDSAGSGILTASMPGKVTAVLVKVGDIVERGQTLMVLEAMKMELHISAPFDGTVRKIHGASGETVSRDDVLVEIDSDISAAT